MTLAMEGAAPQELLDLRAREGTPSLDRRALRDRLDHQDEVTMDNLDHQDLLDLQDQPCLELTEGHRPSVFLDHRDHLELLDSLDTPQG